MDRHKPRVLSPVPEEEAKVDERVRCNKDEDEEKQENTALSETEADTDDDGSLPLEIDVHGVKAKVYLNCADIDIIPARYLEKADRSHLLRRIPWIFRAAKDGREVNISKWSKVDIRFRGVFKALTKVPVFKIGLFDGDGTGSGRMSSSSGFSSSSALKIDFEEAVKAQAQVVYALLDEVLNMLKLRREMESHKETFFLRPRLVCCQPEYWTGYRAKHRDSPFTAGSLSLDYEPYQDIPRAVVPVAATAERRQPLKKTLEGEFKLLLAQFLVSIHRLAPPGDKFPDQEVFLISLHGSKLHILRGVFPGQKTSKLWCGRHRPSDIEIASTHSHTSKLNERFYSKTNIERFMEQAEWDQLSNPDNVSGPRSFQILGSREYDLWMKWEFAAALKMLSGLMMYLMSGQARCGVLQDVFAQYPYDEDYEAESDDAKERAAKEQKHVEEEEAKLKEFEEKKREEGKDKAIQREAMRTSMKDKIGGFAEGLCQPWWDWVWDDKKTDARAKNPEDELIVGGP